MNCQNKIHEIKVDKEMTSSAVLLTLLIHSDVSSGFMRLTGQEGKGKGQLGFI